MNPRGLLSYAFKQAWRHRLRTGLTLAGVAVAMFLFTTVQALQRGVAEATTASANDTALVVYRKDRYCPVTSRLPQSYQRRIEQVPGVVQAIPVRVVVSNCRTSLDVVTFRGVPKDQFLRQRSDDLELLEGSLDAWLARSDAALVGHVLARRRNLKPGQAFDAAGITATVAGVFRSKDPQDHNVAYTDLAFLQLAGRDELGIVTQFNVQVDRAASLEPVARAIDALFEHDQDPTQTFGEKAFVARIAHDLVQLVGFARWLGLGAIAAVAALVANAIVLSVQSRIAEHAVLQTLGFTGRLVALLIIAEGAIVALAGGLAGAAAAMLAARLGGLALSVEGQSIPIHAGWELVATGVGVCVLLGVLASLVPALQASSRPIARCLRAA